MKNEKRESFMNCLIDAAGGLLGEMPEDYDPISVYFDGNICRLVCWDTIEHRVVFGTAMETDQDQPALAGPGPGH